MHKDALVIFNINQRVSLCIATKIKNSYVNLHKYISSI